MSKTRMCKRVASLLLSLVMMLSLLPTTVYATGDTGETKNAIVEETNTSDDNTVGGTTGNPELTGEDEGGGGTIGSEGETATVATIGEAKYETLDAAIEAVADGQTIVVNAGEYTLNGSLAYADKAFTIAAADGADVSFDMSAAVALHGAKITFNNVTFNYKTNGNYIGLQHADTLVYNNCTINGMVFLYAVNETFNSCTFKQESPDAYNVWTYGAQNVAFNGCTFNCVGKAVLVYNEGAVAKTDLTVTDTKFVASAPVTGKAAIEIDTSLMAGGATITVDEQTTAAGFATGSNSGKTLWNDKKQTADTNKNTTVTVAGEKVFEPKATVVKPVSVNGTSYETLEDAIDAATPDANGVVTYEISGKVDVTATGWVQVAKSGLTGLTAVKFVGTTDDAKICINGGLAILADQNYDIDVSFEALALSKLNPTYGGDYGHSTNYFTTWLRNSGAAENTVTYTNCTFPNGVSNNQYGKTVFDNCKFTNGATGLYNLWNYGGSTEIKNSSFTGTRGIKAYSEGADGGQIEVADTTFNGLGEKAAIVVSKATTVTLNKVDATECTKGLLQKDIDGGSLKTTIEANGTGISGKFDITATTTADAAKNEFNISAGTFTSEVSNDYCADGFEVKANDNGTYGVVEAATAAGDGTEANPYTLEQLGTMTRQAYIDAQNRLNGIMYVTVGDYAYDINGVLGNGVRDDTTGQIPDHSKLNAYGENGYLGEKNDGANGKSVVFVGGSITSGVKGYTSIDHIGTSLLLALPAYTNVTFEGITFNNVMSFNYQLYTSPWSQLGELKFDGCTFNGIIVGAIAAQTLTFNGCEFKNYINADSANNSNPTWIRPAYGNWTQGDNEGQGSDFRSLTTINFTDNKVTSTRPVKFEYISQWNITSTVTATGNSFDISKQDGDTTIKNVGLYLGAHTDANAFNLVAENNTKSANTAALYTIPEGKTSLPLGSTVKDTKGNEVELADALKWKAGDATADKLTLKSVPLVTSAVASIGTAKYETLAEAFAAAKDGDTITLLTDCSGDGIRVEPNTFTTKGLTVDFAGHTYTVGGKLVGSGGTKSNGFQLNKDNKITFRNGAIYGDASVAGDDTTNWTGAPAILIQNYCDLTLSGMKVSGGYNTVYTMSNNCGTVVIENTTINAGGGGSGRAPFALDACGYSDYTGVSVTVKGTSTINGDIEVSRSASNENAVTLTLENGTVNGTLKIDSSIKSGDATTVTKSANVTLAAPDGYLWNAAGELVVAVAQVGENKYETLAAAIAAANAGETVTLLKDVTENVEIAKEKNLTLDLNGKTLNGGTGTAKAALSNLGTITIRDTSADKTGTIKRDDTGTVDETSYYVIRNQGTMTIESGIVTNNSGYRKTNPTGSMVGSSLICNGDCDEGGTLTIKGGTFTQNNFIAIKNGALGVLHVTGGTITSNHSAIQNWFEADITGGKITGQLWTDAWEEGKSVGKTTIGGDATFAGEIVMDITGSVAPTLAINGGNLNVTRWRITNAAAKAGAKPAVSGGTFTSAVPAEYCAEGFIPTANADGSYGVKAGAYVAQIGDVKYETLQAAIDAVKANETIYVLGNIDLGTDELSTYDVKTTVKNVTIDLGGYTVTSAGRFTVYLQVNGWTIQNGTIQNTNASTTYGTLYVGGKSNSTTLKNLTVESKTNGVQFAIASSKNGIKASITVEDGTKISGNYGVYMKGQPKPWRDTRDGQEILNVNGGEITGTTAAIAVFGAGKDNTKAGVIVNINGGKVYSDSYAIAGNGSSVLENTTINISGGKVFSNKDTAIYHPQAGTVTISGGEVYGVTGGVQMCAGTLNVTGGTISATGNGDVSGKTGDGSIPDGAAVSIVNRAYPAGAPTMTISGGTFTSADGVGAVQAYGWKNNSQQTWDKPNAAVSGGTFTSAVKEEYCATGYIPTANADGTYGVKEGVYVAQIRDVKYETLQAAIDAAKGGSTVRLLADVTLTETAVFPAGKTVHLNLAGHNITATGTALLINGTTDIQDTKRAGTIESTGNVAVAVGNNAKVTVYSGTLKGREGAVITGKSTGATIEIRYNATLIATDNAVIAGNGSQRDGKPNTILVKGSTFIGNIETKGYIACGIYAPWNDNVTVSGGTFNITNGAGIVARAGTVKVTGGTFSCTGTAEGYVGDSKNKVPCAALVFDEAANYPALTPDSKILVSGGSFSTDPAANGAKLADGYVAIPNADGVYKVAKANPVAAIGDVKYDTLQAAITAAQDTKDGATITLLTDINTSSYYEVKGENPVTIDLAGHNITGSGISGLFYVTVKGDLTIKGEGTVTAVEDNKAAMAVWVRSSFAKVTLEGGTYTQQITNTADPHFDLIYVERGNVYVKGGTYKGFTPDWTLNCKDDYYQSKEANIEVTGGTFVGFDPANNKAEGENTNFVPAGYVSTKGADGNFVVTEVKVAEVNGVAYATLSEAIAAAKDGDTVKLLRDINTPEISYMISKSLTIDLNGMTVTGSGYDAVFQIDNADAKVVIKNGKVVAVEQSGSAGKYTMAIWASKAGCEVTLEGLDVSQKITHTEDPQMDMIYASGGTITINSGNFVSGTPAWTLNCNDTSYKNGTANITVTGGTFVGFDPANNKAEGEGTSFVAAGYVSRMDEDGSYTVVPEDAKITVNKSLTLGNTLTMTYKVLLPEGYTSEKMVFEFYNDDIKGYDTVEVLNGNYNNTTKRYEFAFTGINPQRMNDTLKAKMYAKDANGNEVIYSVDDYSVAMYCNALLSSEANKDGKYTKLIASLVAYGTASQKYMNYRTDTLVSSIVDAGAADDYTAQLAAVQAVNNRIPGTGVTIKAKSLVLTNAFAIRVKFVLDSDVSIDDVYFTVNSDSTQYKEFKQSTLSDGTVCYYFDYTGLNASELDDAFTFTAHTGTGTGDALTYNANTYLNGMYKVLTDRGDTTSALYEIVTALFNYGWTCDHF